jgi:hypothetical protein
MSIARSPDMKADPAHNTSLLLALLGSLLGCSSSTPAQEHVGSTSQTLASIELQDFYYQDVCYVDPTMDPYECQGASRNINLDEALQYMMTDGNGAQGTVSVPVRLGSANPGDPLGVLHLFDYNGGEHGGSAFLEFNTASGAMSSVNPDIGWPNDGWDVMEYSGTWASYVGTADPTSRVVNWVQATGEGTCVLQDSWLLWDQTQVDWNYLGSATASLRGAGGTGGAALCQSDAWNDTSPTSWYLYPSICYDSGKCLPSLVTWHNTSDNGAREVDFYTKPYGRTRWEAWSCLGGVNCSMTDHRDWSFYRGSIDSGGWYPAFQWPVYYPQAKGNWLAGGDFGMAAMNWDGGGTQTWNRWNGPDWAEIQEWPGGVRNGNHYLAVSAGADGWHSVYQDVPAGGAGPGWWFAFGLQSLAANVGNYGYVIVRVWELGTPYYHDLTFTPNGWDRTIHLGWFETQGNPYAYRFEFYFSGGFSGWFDSAFLTQT